MLLHLRLHAGDRLRLLVVAKSFAYGGDPVRRTFPFVQRLILKALEKTEHLAGTRSRSTHRKAIGEAALGMLAFELGRSLAYLPAHLLDA